MQLALGVGKMMINGRDISQYFATESQRNFVEQPFNLTDTNMRYDMIARVKGGGLSGQAGAVRHAISRALVMMDEAHKEVLKDSGCLTRDPRMKERKKPGQPGARKRFQFSKR